jgi:hypothetical protein
MHMLRLITNLLYSPDEFNVQFLEKNIINEVLPTV